MVMWLPGVWIADVIKLLHILAPVSPGQKKEPKKGGEWGVEGRNEWSKFKLLISFSGRRVPGLLSVCASVLFLNLRPITYSTPHPQMITFFPLSPRYKVGENSTPLCSQLKWKLFAEGENPIRHISNPNCKTRNERPFRLLLINEKKKLWN